jgi:hypothetical protein
LRYSADRPPVGSTVEGPGLEIQASPMNFAEQVLMSDGSLGPNTTIEGHPARQNLRDAAGDAYRDQLTLWEVNGLKLVVTVAGQRARALAGADGAHGVFRHVAVYQQRADWVPVPPLAA